MKLSSSGFTLVELMIVIAILGILITVLFPSVTGYMTRGRDTGRITDLKTLYLAVSSFSHDHDSGLPIVPAGCDLSTTLSAYLDGKETKDPLSNINHGCGANSNYAYGTGYVVSTDTHFFSLSAQLESLWSGNWFGVGASNAFTGDLDTTDYSNLKDNLHQGAGGIYAILGV